MSKKTWKETRSNRRQYDSVAPKSKGKAFKALKALRALGVDDSTMDFFFIEYGKGKFHAHIEECRFY